MRNDNDTIYLQPGAQVTVDGGEAGKLTIKTASPTWNTDKPTKEGYYWYRDIINGPRTFRSIGCLPRLAFTAPDIVRIHESDEPGEMVVSGMEECEWADFDGEWSGPIEAPK